MTVPSRQRPRRRTSAVAPQVAQRSRTHVTVRTPPPSKPVLPLPPLTLGHYPFLGPFLHWQHLEHRAGILALVQRAPLGPLPYRVLWVGEAEDVQAAVGQWQARERGGSGRERVPIAYAALYTDVLAGARKQIVAELRAQAQPPEDQPTIQPLGSPAPLARTARRRTSVHRGA